MRWIGVIALAAACGGGTAAAPKPDEPVAPAAKRTEEAPRAGGTEIAGTYSVFAGGGWARGEASIARKGAAYQIVWTYSAEKTVTGIGIRDGDRLLVGYDMKGGPVSVGAYRIDGGKLSAQWISSEGGDRLGTESGTLAPDGFVAGIHSVTGTDASGSKYAGQIYVREIGDGYRMWMMQGDERTRDGIALRSGDLIVWAWGEGDSYGAADYRIASDGDALAGQWTRRGEYRAYWEVLSRRAGAGDEFTAPEDGPLEEEMAAYRDYQRELAALGHALRAANLRVRNDCNVSSQTVDEFIADGGDKLRDVLRKARVVMDRYRHKKWEDVPAPDPGAADGLYAHESTAVRCITSARYDEAQIALERASLDEEQAAWIAVEVTVECSKAVPDVEHHVARARMRRSHALVHVLDAETAKCGK